MIIVRRHYFMKRTSCFEHSLASSIIHKKYVCSFDLQEPLEENSKVKSKRKTLNDWTKDDLVRELVECRKKLALVEKNFETSSGLKQKKLCSKRKARNTDFLNCNYRHVALKVVYLGWKFDGLQNVPSTCNTVEWMLIKALQNARLVGKDLPVRFSRSGRTDKKVSSFAQVLSLLIRTKYKDGPHVVKWFDHLKKNIDNNKPEESKKDPNHNSEIRNTDITVADQLKSTQKEVLTEKLEELEVGNMGMDESSSNLIESNTTDDEFNYVRMLNQSLPSEIRVVDWAPVDKTFAARYLCRNRVYHYYFWRGTMNIDKMQQAAKLLCGVHDFRNFCRLSKHHTNFLRDIKSIEFFKATEDKNGGEMYYAKIIGLSFLRMQVRYMMTILFLIGLEKEEPELIAKLLDVDKTPNRPAYAAAPAHSLVLHETEFEDLKWVGGFGNHKRLAQFFQMHWSKSCQQTEILRDITLKYHNLLTIMAGQVSHGGGRIKVTEYGDKGNGEMLPERYMYCEEMQHACYMWNKPYKPVMKKRVCASPEEIYADWKGNTSSTRWLKAQARLKNQ